MNSSLHTKILLISMIVVLCAFVSPALAQATALTASATPTNVAVGQTFVIDGFLTNATTGTGLTTEFVTVVVSADGGVTFVPAVTTTTFTGGEYRATQSQAIPGTYIYGTIYQGSLSNDPAVSNGVAVTVGAPTRDATSLTITATPSNPAEGATFVLSGILMDLTTGTGLSGQFVSVEVSKDDGATWNLASTTATFAGGAYNVNQAQGTAGNYLYRANFAGTTDFAPIISDPLLVVVGAPPGPDPTSISITATPANPAEGVTFVLSGALMDLSTGTGLAGQFVSVEVSTNNGTTWNLASTTTTFTGGAYAVNQAQNAAGNYLYRANYAGTTDFAAVISDPLLVVVGAPPGPDPTSISITATPANPAEGAAFVLSGTLTDLTTGTGLPGQFVSVEVSTNNGTTWNLASTTTTFTGGAYAVNQAQNAAGNYLYRANYAGTTDFAAVVSDPLLVVVGAPPGPDPTSITITSTPSNPAEGATFVLDGFLMDTATGTGLAGQFVSVEVSTNNGTTWNLAETTTTFTGGEYAVDQAQAAAGNYLYRANFAGTTDFATVISDPLLVVVGAPPGPDPTTITITSTPTNPAEGATFVLDGFLTDLTTGAGLAGQFVSVEVSTNNGTTWNLASTTTTFTGGAYAVNQAQNAAGNYLYRANYAGTTDFAAVISDPLLVVVGAPPGPDPTSITITSTPSNPAEGATFVLDGFLTDLTTGAGLAGQFVSVEVSANNGTTWNLAETTTTFTGGEYAVDQAQAAAGNYLYRANFAGTTDFAAVISDPLLVVVGAPPGPDPTSITITSTPSNPAEGATFVLDGFLTDLTTGAGLAGQFVSVEVSANNGTTWNLAETTTTFTGGEYAVDQAQAAAGNYLYRANYAGTTDFAAVISDPLLVVVGAPPGPDPTTITITSTPTNPAEGATFVLDGFLTDLTTGAGLAGQFVSVEVSTNNGTTWNLASTTSTFTGGEYTVNQAQAAAGNYLYRANFAGTTDFAAVISDPLLVVVGAPPGPDPTSITITSTPSNPAEGATFVLDGFLTDLTTGAGLAGQFVSVEVSTNNGTTWNLASTTSTFTGGEYTVNQAQAAAGNYLYRANYAGTTDFAAVISDPLLVVVGAPPGPDPTSITITSTPSNPAEGATFVLDGFLTDLTTGAGLAGQFVSVEVSTNNGTTWNLASSTTTFTGGEYTVNQAQAAAGNYLYRANYAGTTDFAPVISDPVTVTVGAPPGPDPTAINITATPTNPATGATFVIDGFLTDTATGSGIADQFVSVEVSIDNGTTWNLASSTTTFTGGEYTVNQAQATADTYLYRANYAGTTDFAPVISDPVTVTVGAASALVAVSPNSAGLVSSPAVSPGIQQVISSPSLVTPAGLLYGPGDLPVIQPVIVQPVYSPQAPLTPTNILYNSAAPQTVPIVTGSYLSY